MLLEIYKYVNITVWSLQWLRIHYCNIELRAPVSKHANVTWNLSLTCDITCATTMKVPPSVWGIQDGGRTEMVWMKSLLSPRPVTGVVTFPCFLGMCNLVPNLWLELLLKSLRVSPWWWKYSVGLQQTSPFDNNGLVSQDKVLPNIEPWNSEVGELVGFKDW